MRINYNKDGKYYVTLQHEIMHHLLRNFDSNNIKVYIVLKIYCDMLKNKSKKNLLNKVDFFYIKISQILGGNDFRVVGGKKNGVSDGKKIGVFIDRNIIDRSVERN